MIIAPDMSEVQDFSPVEPGTYKTRIVNAELKTSAKGNTYLNWELQIVGAEGDAAKFNNRKLFAMTMTSGKAAGKLRDLWTAATGTEMPKQIDTDMLLGREVIVSTVRNIRPDGTDGQVNVNSYKAAH